MTVIPVHRPLRVFGLMLGAGVLLALMVVFARLAAQSHIAIVEITFFRNLVGSLCLLVLIATNKQGFALLKTRRPWGHVFRASVGIIGLSFNFWAATLMPLADASALLFAMPLMLTILAIPLLSETVDWRRWVTVILGFIGILVIAQPTGHTNLFSTGVALIGALFTALSVIAVRRLGSSEPELRTVFYFFVFGALAMGLILPWHWTTPSFEALVYLVATGLSGTLGQIMLTRAYAEAPAGFLSPFNYLSIIYSTFFGWLLWGEWPAMIFFIGSAIVIGAGLANIALEKTRAREKADGQAAYG